MTNKVYYKSGAKKGQLKSFDWKRPLVVRGFESHILLRAHAQYQWVRTRMGNHELMRTYLCNQCHNGVQCLKEDC